MYKPKRSQASRHTPRRAGRGGSPLRSAIFFPVAVLYEELLVKGFDKANTFFSIALLRILFFSLAAGLAFFLLLDLLPWKKLSRGIGIAACALGYVYACIEYCCKSFYKDYFSLGYVGDMAGQVLGSFFKEMIDVIIHRIPFILLAAVPLVLFILWRKGIVRDQGQERAVRIVLLVFLVICQLFGFLLSNFGKDKAYYTYNFNANDSIPRYGMVSCLRLELEHAIFGMPEEPLPIIDPGDLPSGEPSADPTGEPTDAPTEEPTEEPSEEPIVYGYNELYDFDALAAKTSSDTFKSICKYFGSLQPSQQNEYTGYFAGKNLILLTAEAFSPYVISEELTPTLYRLTHEGFVCNNFYQPNWTMSTIGGEFANTTGIIPMWGVQGKTSYAYSKNVNMGMSLAYQFQKLGYVTPAWHDHDYKYYGRNGYLANLGYDYKGIGSGLELATHNWPNSDLEMMQATVDGYIRDYVENGTNFHAYYMTVSGHCNYNWANAMAKRNKDTAQAAYPNFSDPVQAYIACNLELEYAMEYLVNALEEAGIADDTVIVMTSDHYPYSLPTEEVDYYNELTGLNDSEKKTSRYRNALILWCGCMEEPVYIDAPASSIDIVPTICNLFGLPYDSRIYSGRDILATNYEPDQVSTCMPLVLFTDGSGSFLTAAGTYEGYSKTFTPFEGVTVDDGYVAAVKKLISAKTSYAKSVIANDYYKFLFGNT